MTRMGQGWIAGAIVALAVGTAEIRAQEPFRWSGRIAQGGTLEVKGVAGRIRAELASGNTVEVTAVKTGDRDDFDGVEIRVVKRGADVTVCAVYGGPGGGDACEGRGVTTRGFFRRHRSLDVGVDFVVKLPPGTSLRAALVSGDVDVRRVHSDVRASTVAGDITIVTTGTVRAETVSGALDVTVGASGWNEMDLNTVSGDITLRLPRAANADVEFQSVSGDLTTELDLRLTGRLGRRWPGTPLSATLGEGGHPVTLKTVSGDVRLLRAG